MNKKILSLFFLLISRPLHAENFELHNIQVLEADSKINSLMQEKNINRSLFLPELSLKGGVGSEKILDISPETEKGPFLYLDSKINLYHGGRDSFLQSKTEKEITIARMVEEMKKRDLRIETYKKLYELKTLEKESELIKTEIELNKGQQRMAKKKVDAGLTTSVDLLDFDLKDELLTTELDKNIFKTETLKKELLALYAGKVTLLELEKTFEENVSLINEEDNRFNPALLIAQKRWETSQLAKANAKAEYLPSVDLEAKYGQITPQHKLFGEEKEHQVTLSITLPLFSGFSTTGKSHQAVIETTQAERELRQSELDLETKKELELKRIDLLKRNLISLERLLARSLKYNELTISDYRRGVKNSPDVIAASDKKFEVQKKILETKLELSNAVYSFNETFKSYKGDYK